MPLKIHHFWLPLLPSANVREDSSDTTAYLEFSNGMTSNNNLAAFLLVKVLSFITEQELSPTGAFASEEILGSLKLGELA
jgi:hypothetical protein